MDRNDNNKNHNEDRNLFLILVLIPLGLAGCAWIWSRHSFGYALLFALFYGAGAYFMFYNKK